MDVKVPLPKVQLSKTTLHATSTFQNNRLENKLPQKLDDMIISNTVQGFIRTKITWPDF